MNDSTKPTNTLMLHNVRLSWIFIFEKDKPEDGVPKYRATMIIDPSTEEGKANVARMEKAMDAVAKDKWPKKLPKKLEYCLGEGDEDKDTDKYPEYAGMMFFNANNDKRPRVIDRQRNPITADDDIIYPGCYANVSIGLWAQDNAFGKKVNANIRGVQFFADGEALGGGGSVAGESEFEEYEQQDNDEWDS